MLSITPNMYIGITIVPQENMLFLYNVKNITGTQMPQNCSLAPLHFPVTGLLRLLVVV